MSTAWLSLARNQETYELPVTIRVRWNDEILPKIYYKSIRRLTFLWLRLKENFPDQHEEFKSTTKGGKCISLIGDRKSFAQLC